jgi:hypothetical protein
VFEGATHEYAQRAAHFALHREPRPVRPAADAVEVRPARSFGTIADERRAVALPEIAQAVGAGHPECQRNTPTVPVCGRLRVDDEGVAPLRARAGVEGDAAEIRLRAVGKAHGARPVVMPAKPESVYRVVIHERVQVIDPVVLWIWLVLRGEGGGQREE